MKTYGVKDRMEPQQSGDAVSSRLGDYSADQWAPMSLAISAKRIADALEAILIFKAKETLK